MKRVFKYLLAGILLGNFINGAEASFIIGLVAPPLPANCFPPPSGLVAWWPGESNAFDSIAGNNGILMNGAGFAPGEVNTAFDLNGGTFVLANPAVPGNLDVGAGAGLTFEAWINPSSTNSQMPLFEYERVLGSTDGSDIGILGYINLPGPGGNGPGSIYLNLSDSVDGHVIASAGGSVAAGVWQHVALTYDKASGVAVIYVNGTNVAQANLGTFTPQTTFTNLLLGARTYFGSAASPSDKFSGQLDEISLYNRALSSNEVAGIYFAGAAGKCPGLPQPPYIITPPASQTVVEGNPVQLSVTAGGVGPLSYQWMFKNKVIAGANTDTLYYTNIHPYQAGNYKVQVSNVSGSVTSSPAMLTVTAQNILIYSYSGNEKNTALGSETSYGFSGQLIITPDTATATFIGWATISGKKQYWITPSTDYLLFTIKGSQNRSYTVFGKASDGATSSPNNAFNEGYLSSFIHRGQNANLTIGTGKNYLFPNTLTFNNTQVFPDSQTTNYIMLEAASNYSFLTSNTKTANDTGQTVADLISAQVKSLVKQGYQPQ